MGIETSCDETGVGFVKDGVLLGDALASSMDEHARFGGVVPEVAARAHVNAMVPMVNAALERAEIGLADVGAVAVTAGPGLTSALQVGIAAAKSYALALALPIYAVHHLAGHAAADTLEHGPLPSPCVVLIVSGGHTSLLLVRDLVDQRIVHLSDTWDDAAGEAFDKIARLLGLGYPGGPAIDRAARHGDPEAIAFPRAMVDEGLDFSFSGLKTAVVNHVRKHPEVETADVAASFQRAVVDVLVTKARRAATEVGAGAIALGGGVAANSLLREELLRACDADGRRAFLP